MPSRACTAVAMVEEGAGVEWTMVLEKDNHIMTLPCDGNGKVNLVSVVRPAHSSVAVGNRTNRTNILNKPYNCRNYVYLMCYVQVF
jgi:hypothetical protein